MDSRKKITDKNDAEYKVMSNMKYVGPGMWLSMHFMAVNINTQKKMEEFKYYLDVMNKNIPCMYCRNHMATYLKENSLPKKPEAVFEWTIKFHNSVNKRLGYPVITMDKATELYLDEDGVCTAECDDSLITPVVSSPVKSAIEKKEVTLPKNYSKVRTGFRIVSVY